MIIDVILWGFEKNTRWHTIPEGLYLLSLFLRNSGYATGVNFVSRKYVDAIKKFIKSPGFIYRSPRHIVETQLTQQKLGAVAALFHGIQAYEADLNYITPLVSFLKNSTNSLIVIGGAFATAAPRQALAATGADLVLGGECEHSIIELAKRIRKYGLNRDNFSAKKNVLRGIPGLYFVSNSLKHEQPVSFPLSLPYIPESLDEWHKTNSRIFGPKAVKNIIYPLSSSRGCPKNCLICTHTNGKSQRRYTDSDIGKKLDGVISGMKRLKDKGKVEKIFLQFNDDDFFLNRGYALRIMDVLIKQSVSDIADIVLTGSVKSLFCGTSPDTQMIDTLKRTGAAVLNIGTDAFSDDEIKNIKSGAYSFEMITALVSCLEKRGIINNHFWILSSPFSTLISVVEQLRNVHTLMIAHRYFMIVYPNLYVIPYFGSKIRNDFEKISQTAGFSVRQYTTSATSYILEGNKRLPLVFYEKSIPLDEHAAYIIALLDRELNPEVVDSIPYSFDFQRAFELIAGYVETRKQVIEGAELILNEVRILLDSF